MRINAVKILVFAEILNHCLVDMNSNRFSNTRNTHGTTREAMLAENRTSRYGSTGLRLGTGLTYLALSSGAGFSVSSKEFRLDCKINKQVRYE